MTKLALLRHGHTAWNRQGRIQGRTDIPLDTEAAETLAGLSLPPEWVSADLCSSPLTRASQTAELVAGRAPLSVPELTEMDWGEWEGKRGIELKADPKSGFRDLEHWGWDYRPPNGESPAEVRDRLEPLVKSLSRDTVAVCHIGIMRVLLAMAHDWNFRGTPPFRIKRNRLFIINLTDGKMTPAFEPQRLIARQCV
ncbi:MAG: histidine phosphatase family protein [Rhodobacteraceae bacterium]|nr:histidine phosphatase family protein [Paracoccaceae bacterium]